ncbi:carboxypeptidase regulatory-like domain-containing protein [bacterium]|nr:carboxypeptidase regulatory-like domain-containing protein [bacterium]
MFSNFKTKIFSSLVGGLLLAATQSQAGVITGTVTDDSLGTGIGNASVTFFYSNSPVGILDSLFTFTNPSGSYTIQVPSSVVYFGYATAPNYQGEFYDNQSSLATATPIQVGNSATVNFQLSYGSTNPPTDVAWISGNVSLQDPNGVSIPVPFAYVYAMENNFLQTIYPTFTDQLGNYTIGVPTTAVSFFVAAVDPTNPGGQTQYWDHVNSASAATPLTLVPNQTTSGIDFDFNGATNPTDIAWISGTVSLLDSSGGNPTPISDAFVTAYNSGMSFSAVSDSAGNYTIGFPQTGTFTVSASFGFAGQTQYWDHVNSASAATPVTVSANQIVSGINFDFNGTTNPTDVAWISGTVSQADSTNPGGVSPVAGAIVAVMPNSPILPVFSAVTDNFGNYTVGLPSAGSYLAYAMLPSGVMQFWDHVSDVNLASAINVAQNQTVTGINFDFGGNINPPPAINSISGMVTTLNVPPMGPQAFVEAYQFIDSLGSNIVLGQVFTAFTNNGSYTITNLPPGGYLVKATLLTNGLPSGTQELWYNQASSVANAQIVTVVQNQNTANIDFTFATSGSSGFSTVIGTVTGTDTSGTLLGPVANAEIYLFYNNVATQMFTTTSANGTYVLQGVPIGVPFKLGCFAPGFYPEYYQNQNDLFSANTLIINNPTGAALTGIDFSLELFNPNYSNNSISGTISNLNGSPVENALVIVVSSSELDSPSSYTTTLTDNLGAYQVSNLGPEDYYVFALGNGLVPTFYANVQNWQNATLVTVNNSSATNINISLPTVFDSSFCEIGGIVNVDDGTTANSVNQINPLPNALVYAVGQNGNVLGYAFTEPDGSYKIQGVITGNYTIYATKLGLGTENSNVSLGFANLSVNSVDFVLMAVTDAKDEQNETVSGYSLKNNYPNPFNPTTTIEFAVPEFSSVKITVYNALGQLVKTLANQNFVQGTHNVVWNGTNENGKQVSSGIYFYRFETANYSQTKRMLFLK